MVHSSFSTHHCNLIRNHFPSSPSLGLHHQEFNDHEMSSSISTGSKFRRSDSQTMATTSSSSSPPSLRSQREDEVENNQIIQKIQQIQKNHPGVGASTTESSGSSASVTILFDPPILEYGSTPVCIPSITMFTLINPLDLEFDLLSIQSDNAQFYPVVFQPQSVSPQDTVQIQILYLPYYPQASQATLTLTTSIGEFEYPVNTAPAYNSYHLHPFLGHRLATGLSLQHSISIYNPHAQPLHIREIYTTESFLSLEGLLPHEVDTNNNPLNSNQWILEPGAERNIISLIMTSSLSGYYTGYVHIKTNYDNLVLPVELTVVEGGGLHVTPTSINFGILTNVQDFSVVNISLFNSGSQPVEIIEMFAANSDSNLQILSIHELTHTTTPPPTENTILNSQTETMIAQLVYRASIAVGKVTNRIIIITNHSNPALAILEIPYEVSCVHGGIGYEFNQALFILPIRNMSHKHVVLSPSPSSGSGSVSGPLSSAKVSDLMSTLTNKSSASFTDLRNLTLTNYFSLTLHILHIESVSCRDFITIHTSPQPLISPSLKSYQPITLLFNKVIAQEILRTKDSLPHQCWLDIHTNFSTVRLPLVVIDGNVDMKPIGEIVVSVVILVQSSAHPLSLSLLDSSRFKCNQRTKRKGQ
jgi:hypothetical protein